MTPQKNLASAIRKYMGQSHPSPKQQTVRYPRRLRSKNYVAAMEQLNSPPAAVTTKLVAEPWETQDA